MRQIILTTLLLLTVIFDAFAAKSDNVTTTNSRYNITMNNGFSDIVSDLLPAVVNISTSQKIDPKTANSINEILKNIPEGTVLDSLKESIQKQPLENRDVVSLGSGFIISQDGYIVTNNHVIEKSGKITVTLNSSKSYEAKIIGVDKKTDLALLKIEAKEKLPYVKMGDSSQSKIGEWVIAVGNPFGLGGSVSVGIISAQSRDINSGKFDNFIQTDAAINKGNSGGPLFNIKGEVVGVATAIFSPSGGSVGIGFATPTSTAIAVIEQLKSKGEVTRGWIGVSIQNVTDEMANSIDMKEAKGAFIVEVNKDGPASNAGIIPTDIITKFDQKEIKVVKDLPEIVSKTPIGKEVEVEIIRQNKPKIIKLKVAKLNEDALDKLVKGIVSEKKIKAEANILGMDLVTINKELRESRRIDPSVKGVLVSDVKKGSVAALKGVEKGDIIISVNQIEIASVAQLKKLVDKSKEEGKENIFLLFERKKLVENDNVVQEKSKTLVTILPLKEYKQKQQ